ncbi:hypothetical protein FJY84_05170 [Candidatus Bathyarchaeota archaeon]|nr:hypothetical protein [Candidatus Bathyarchaeota archaeon]
MRRVDTDERISGVVPLDHFQGSAFKEKKYLKSVMNLVKEGFDKLKITKDEPLHICTGYILSEVRKALVNEGYVVVPSRIIGITQEYAENEFIKSLERLGVGTKSDIKKMRSFKGFLKWVHQDINSREKYVKTGWAAWPRLKRDGSIYE